MKAIQWRKKGTYHFEKKVNQKVNLGQSLLAALRPLEHRYIKRRMFWKLVQQVSNTRYKNKYGGTQKRQQSQNTVPPLLRILSAPERIEWHATTLQKR